MEPKITDDLIKKIIKIPNRPSEYYKGELQNWDDFLGKELSKAILVLNELQTPTTELNADQNLKNLINGDKNKIKYSRNDLSDIELPINIDSIKKYVNSLFGIDCIVVPKVRTKNNGKYESCLLQIKRKEDNKNSKIPIVITCDTGEINYDNDIFDIPMYSHVFTKKHMRKNCS